MLIQIKFVKSIKLELPPASVDIEGKTFLVGIFSLQIFKILPRFEIDRFAITWLNRLVAEFHNSEVAHKAPLLCGREDICSL